MKAETVSRNRPEIVTKSNEKIGLGVCIFDPDKSEVRRQTGEIVPLRAQSIEVLSILAVHLNETVSKNTLVEAVWNDTFVTDDSLVQCISEIRKSIDDTDHKIIQTFAKKGYRLNAHVVAKTKGQATPRPMKAVLIGACVFLLSVVGLSALFFQQGVKSRIQP